MIPLRLSVKNFMCYREDVPVLDLDGVHVACLCGDNGHGKTALLDAMTWALWGQARARTQEELVHQGQLDMAVELDFMAHDQRYRVSRRHSRSARSKQGATILEFQVLTGNGARPITGNVMRDTQKLIHQTIHMDYETFTNTAYLRQGDADRFTTSGPAKRKQTLAEVLDLSYFEGLEERARERRRALQDKLTALQGWIELRQQEAARKPEYELQLAQVNESLSALAPGIETQQRKVEDLRRSVATLFVQRQELDSLSRRVQDGQRDISQLEVQVRQRDEGVRSLEDVLRKEVEIRERFAALESSRGDLERLDAALALKSDLDGQRAASERELAVHRERLSGQAETLRTRIGQELEPRARSIPEIEEGLALVGREQAALADQELQAARMRDETHQTNAMAVEVELANERLRDEMEETRKKFDMLERGDSQCPLCRQALGPDGQAHLRVEYENLGMESKRRFQENAGRHDELVRKHGGLEVDLAALEATVNRVREETQRRSATLGRDLEAAKRAREELGPALVQLQQAETALREQDFAPEMRTRLAQADAQLSALAYDSDAHRRVREDVKQLQGWADLERTLRDAVQRLPTDRAALEDSRQMLDRRQQEVARAIERKGELEAEIQGLPSLESALMEAEEAYRQQTGRRDEALVKQGGLQQHIETCTTLERELRRQEEERSRLQDERAIYDELTVAFGRNGIQALIIETAIPQLEADANGLLERLTDRRMSLKLQLQEGRKDGRTGLPSEELDIKIADEVGTRSYETFSGGEAFRINFALRIALSKLLARRSGAPLPILFIDEGFGSQDSAGQERLIESIQSIQDDFQKIIVITHLDQIKQSFPVRIEVTKTDRGSTFELT